MLPSALPTFLLLSLRRRGQAPLEVVGQVRALETTPQPGHGTARWSFLVERYDRDGNRLAPLPVVLEGRDVQGVLREGDEVEFAAAARKEGEPLSPAEVRNVTNGSVVRVAPHIGFGRSLLIALLGLGVFALLAALLLGLFIGVFVLLDRFTGL